MEDAYEEIFRYKREFPRTYLEDKNLEILTELTAL